MKNNAARKLEQVPNAYLVIGVDPHKKRHAATMMTQDFTVHSKIKFNNSRKGFEEVLERGRTEMVKTGSRGIMFAIETGGHYWRNMAYFLEEKGIPFRFFNQFTLKRRREGKDINRRKNDYRDSEVAAQLLCTGEFVETRLPQGVYAELRAAHNAYRRLVKERTRITNLIQGLLDGVFPEFTQVFKNPCGLTALSVLLTCPIPGVIAGMEEEQFLNLIKKSHQGRRLMKRKLIALRQAAMVSIGIKAGTKFVSNEISFLVEKLSLIERQICSWEQSLVKLVDETEEGKNLLSIRGLNYLSVAGLLAELGSFRYYHTSKQLIKMAGSNPTESESGGKRGAHTPMSKQGRPVLRYCTWNAVIPMLRFNPDFRSWAKRLRERPVNEHPLNGRAILGVASNKLLRLSFALVKKQAFYQTPQVAMIVR